MRLTLMLAKERDHRIFRTYWQNIRRANVKGTGDIEHCLDKGIKLTRAIDHMDVGLVGEYK